MSEANEQDKLAFERTKLAVDCVKHFTTLATGVIVLTATFYDRFPKPLSRRQDVLLTMICMIVCLFACVTYLVWVGFGDPTTGKQRSYRWLQFIIYYSFVLGVGYLGLFAGANIYFSK